MALQCCWMKVTLVLFFPTVPCTPQRLQASVSCSSNVANMMWSTSRGGQLYSVEATGTDGHVAGCMSHDTRCDLTGLHCGQHYTATMVARDSDCTSPVSDTVELKTGELTTHIWENVETLYKQTVEVRSLHTFRLGSLKLIFQPLPKLLVNKL